MNKQVRKLSDFITPSFAAENNDDLKYDKLTLEQIKQPPSQDLIQKFKELRKTNRKVNDLWNNTIDMKPSRSERDFTLAKELKYEGFTLDEAAKILWQFKHGKVKEAKYPNREIIRCYERSGNDFADKLPDEYLKEIEAQVNPILEARKQGKPLEEDLDRSARFRSVDLHKMNWRTSGRPIYKDFLYDKAITVIYGKSNTGKSFLTSDLAGHIALQRDWNGMKFKGNKNMAVLYIAAEASQSFGVRGRALLKRMGVSELPFKVITEAPSFNDDKMNDAKAIVEEINRIKREDGITIGLVVVDTLAVTFQGNENSSEDMGHYIRNMKYIQNRANTGVLIVHHSGKDQAAGARGSSALQAATDTEMEVKSQVIGEKQARSVEVKKQREGKSGMVVPFGLNVVELGIDDFGDQIDTCHVVLEDDSEFDALFPDATEGLNDNAKAALKALKFYETIPNPDTKRMTSRHVKAIFHHDIVKNNGVFDLKRGDKAMSEVAAMKKPDDAKLKALFRGCELLADNGLTEKTDIYQLVIVEEDKEDKEGTT